ncbi:hypothetical protein BJ322DRAFT_1110106 [Thelephora terrestris]|uniref:Uncharacterized protein n=1 Tax=Thelephora terrestris TaxID=56493 RepID=A0A9P6HD73_9AGAM|nr:hypothetical protein BJ322DRAFT_1110106 [Thelephora terrestris]
MYQRHSKVATMHGKPDRSLYSLGRSVRLRPGCARARLTYPILVAIGLQRTYYVLPLSESPAVFIPEQLNLDPRFIDACLAIRWQDENPFPFLLKNKAGDNVVPRATRLTEKYPYAYSDFYGSGTPCVYKSGPDWPIRKGPMAQGIVREPRPVHGHAIQPTWVSIGTRICDELESVGIMWTSINPLAYANDGEPKPFCPLIICVGVNPGSLLYEDAVAAAAVVKNILTDAGFPDIEVAFIESVVTCFTGPKLLSFNPILDKVPDLRKPFTPALGLSIAPRKYPYHEGTAGLYFRLSKDDDRVVVLTCAHVARPPSVYHNTGMTHKKGRHEEIVALGTMGYDNAVKAMMATIGLGTPLRDKATRVIQRVKAIHGEVVENYTTLDQRTIGFVLHSEKIEVSAEPYKFTNDWALIELYNDKIDWTTFKGNKLWVGGKLSIPEYGNMLFPQPQDQKNYRYPVGGLLQAYDFVREAEMRNPQQLDVHGEKCLLVVKNGLATGTTVGRVNGLESFRRVQEDHHAQQVFRCWRLGLGRPRQGGRIVGLLTGGSGPTDEIKITYLTPYWWIEKQVKAKFPECSLYEVVQ